MQTAPTTLDTLILERTTGLLDQAEDGLRSLWHKALADPRDHSLTEITNASRSIQQALRHLESILEMDATIQMIGADLASGARSEDVPVAV